MAGLIDYSYCFKLRPYERQIIQPKETKEFHLSWVLPARVCLMQKVKQLPAPEWWNKISTAENDQIINSLPEKAKTEACKRELTILAVEQLKIVFENFLCKFGVQLELVCENQNHLLKGSLPEIPEDKLQSLGISLQKQAVGN